VVSVIPAELVAEFVDGGPRVGVIEVERGALKAETDGRLHLEPVVMISPDLHTAVHAAATNLRSDLHGPAHWDRVAATGRKLAGEASWRCSDSCTTRNAAVTVTARRALASTRCSIPRGPR
jgi:hypothetical protein